MARIGETVVIHRDPWAYISHPWLAQIRSGGADPDGAWFAVFNHSRRREPRMHPPSDPLFRTLTTRSVDQGHTWEAPTFAPGFDWSGTECPGVVQTAQGTLLLTQFRFGWYPLGEARRRWQAGEPISLSLPLRGWTEEFDEGDWQYSQHTWARGYHGLYVHRSSDGGRTYETLRVATGPYRDGFTRAGARVLADGRLAYVVTEHHPPHNRFTYLLLSADDGVTWGPPQVVLDDPGLQFGEPDLLEVAPGELLCVLRDSMRTGFLHTCRSSDCGATWSAPEQTPIDGFPGQLVLLADGRVLCTYGRREPPYGIRACLSADGGRSWLMQQEIVLRDDLPNGDLGYPTSVEYAPGRLFTIYYGQDGAGVTFVMGTWCEL